MATDTPALLEQRTLSSFLSARHADRDRMSAPILKYLVDRVMPSVSKPYHSMESFRKTRERRFAS
jgi:hypothetical protein